MPGPKMGARPPDFDEVTIRQSPTMQKWSTMEKGAKLKYACREFVKGNPDDEERLMRRIMIARRNNLKDHATLKKARQTRSDAPAPKKRRVAAEQSDSQVAKEMDVAAVEATRSYRKWDAMADGEEFSYNQKYIKGRTGHDWLLRKNIWRRMRYRRENKKMVQTLKGTDVAVSQEHEQVKEEDDSDDPHSAAGIVDHALLANAASTTTTESTNNNFVNKSVVEAAVAAAEQYAKSETIAAMTVPSDVNRVHNPLEADVTLALDAAAKLAAAAAEGDMEETEVTSV